VPAIPGLGSHPIFDCHPVCRWLLFRLSSRLELPTRFAIVIPPRSEGLCLFAGPSLMYQRALVQSCSRQRERNGICDPWNGMGEASLTADPSAALRDDNLRRVPQDKGAAG
jgi:hypothetical protein